MDIHLGRVGHIGIHVSNIDRSIEFYRKVLGLKITGRWGPPDFGRPICFMRINDKHHDVVLFELSADARKAGIGITSTNSRIRKSPGLDHIAFEVGSREDWLVALGICRFAFQLRRVHCRRNREVGQGDPGGQYQGGVRLPASAPIFHISRWVNVARNEAAIDRFAVRQLTAAK